MSFIKLTRYYSAKPLYLNVNSIFSIECDEENDRTVISSSGNHVVVKESFQEIQNLIFQALNPSIATKY